MTTNQIITELTTIRNGIEGDTFTTDNINQLIKKLRG